MLSIWRKLTPQERRDAKTGYLALSPWIVGFVVFYAFPIIATLLFSFTQWTLAEPPIWVGMDNYVRMFTRDPLFVSSLRATTLFVVISLPAKLVLGLMLALLLNLKIPGMNAFRTIFFIPAVISGVAVSLMWIWFLNPGYRRGQHLAELLRHSGTALVLGPTLGAALGRHHEHLEGRRRSDHLSGRACRTSRHIFMKPPKSMARASGIDSGASPCPS